MNSTQTSHSSAKTAEPWKVLDCDRTLAIVDNWDQLKDVLRSLPRQARTPNAIVDLVSPQGDTLSIGIAGPMDRDNPAVTEPLACLNFTPASRNPPYVTVVGDRTLSYEHGGVVVFRYEEGTWTEILKRNCVPLETMLQVVESFFRTGTLPDWISWEEV
jgi:hypothetical protein